MAKNNYQDCSKLLRAYDKEVYERVEKAQFKLANKARKEVMSVSDVETAEEWHGFKMRKPHGQYRKGWQRHREEVGTTYQSVTIHNRTNWALTHLLAKGHALKVGGRSTGKTVPAKNSKKLYALKDKYEDSNIYITLLKEEIEKI